MIRELRINKGVIALIAGVAVLALACSGGSSSPTAVAMESQPLLVPATANDLGDQVPASDVATYNFWATAIGEPEVVVNGDRTYVRLVVACRHSPEGPDTKAVFRFYGNMMTDGANLWNGADFYATVKTDWKDGRDWYPAYRVLHCRMPDGR